MEKPILVFQTDFTYKEGAVSAMHGVAKCVDPELEIFDASHEIPHFDAWSASYRLWQTVRFWPKGTLFVSVVDPGVGTDRKAAAVRTKDGYYIITPDNGTLTHIAAYHGISSLRQIDEVYHRRPASEGSSVFDGRDLFAYVAARLAAGQIVFEETGPEYPETELVRFPLPEASVEADGTVRGYFEIADPNFGNLWSNITPADFEHAGIREGDQLMLEIAHEEAPVLTAEVPFVRSYGSVEKGAPLLYINELLRISMALREDNLMQSMALGFGPSWTLAVRKID